jgi:Uncharacterized protein conserved in bacteria (DUF2066)
MLIIATSKQSFAAEKVSNKLLEIDIIAKSNQNDADYAKKVALSDAKKQALYQALLKLAPKRAREIYRNLRSNDLNAYIHSYTINRQKQKAGYYEAEVKFRFYKSKLQEVVGIEEGIVNTEADPEGEGLLIIPLFQTGEKLLLFEQGNEWRYALNDVALEVGQGDLVMPFGDVRDQAVINTQAALAASVPSMVKIARRYGTRNVVVATAKLDMSGELPKVKVNLHRVGGQKDSNISKDYNARDERESLMSLFNRAATDTAMRLYHSINDYSLFGESEANKLKALVIRAEYPNGRKWREMLQKLETLPSLVRSDVGMVSTNSAQITLLYRGDDGVIKGAIAARGLSLQEAESGFYLLK